MLVRPRLAVLLSLARNTSVCAGCSAPCLGSCPLGVPIPERTREAHQLLTLS